MKLALGPLVCLSDHTLKAGSGSHGSGGGPNVAIAVSLAALLVSIILPLYLDSRQSPRVSVRISHLAQLDQQANAKDYYLVSAINHGRSEVQINQVNISFTKKGDRSTEIFLVLLDFKLGPSRPHVLHRYSDTYFGVTQKEVDEKVSDIEQCRIYGSLNLSNGYRVVSRRGLLVGKYSKLRKRHPRLRRVKLFIFAKEKSRWR